MRVSSTVKRIGVAALFIAEIAILAAVAYGAGEPSAEGVMVGKDDAIIEVADQQIVGTVSIARVVTPVDGWVIARADRGDGVPGELVGAAPVVSGENRNVGVVIDRSRDYPAGVFISLLADKGDVGAFEYTTGDPNDAVALGEMDAGGGSMGGSGGAAMSGPVDKPLVADGEVVTAYAAITPVSVVYPFPEADIGAAFLDASHRVVTVQRVRAPIDSWVVIMRSSASGEPNEIMGSALVRKGQAADLRIELSDEVEAWQLSALLLADLGTPGVLESDPASPARSADAPYLVLSYYVQIAVVEIR